MRPENGYLIVLPREEAKQFFGHRDDQARLAFLNELLANDELKKSSCDGKWHELHIALQAANPDGSALGQALLGGRPMYQGDDFHVCLVRPDVVPFVAEQGAQLDQSQLPAELRDVSQAVVRQYQEAAEAGEAMVFFAKKHS